jgi:AraC-like DNA-binding protein
MPGSIQDNGCDRFYGIGDGPLDGYEMLGGGRHYRVAMSGPVGRGQLEHCDLAAGFVVTFGDMEFDAPRSAYTSFPETVRIYLTDSGGGEAVFPHCGLLSLESPNATIVIEPAGAPDNEATFIGRIRYVCLFIRRDALETLYSGGIHELPAVLRAFVQGDLQRTVACSLPLSAALLRCLDEVQSCRLQGRGRRLFLQSKALEIVCEAVGALQHADGVGSSEMTRLTVGAVLRAQRLLAENFVTPPSLRDLARKVGLSRTALCISFRQVLGQSVFDYIQHLRMQQALALLNEPDRSIADVAYAVGYNRASSFSVAVHRHFGATPTELRRRTASPKA